MLLEARIMPTLLRLSAPNVLNLLALVGLITFDALFVGQLGAEALAGLTLVFPWMMLMQHTAASGMGGAVSSAIARALGAGRRDVADALATHALVLTLALACIFSIAMLAGGPVLYRAMGGRGEVLAAALSYSNVVFAGSLSVCALNLLGSIVRGTGNMSFPATVIVGSVLGHIVISPVLIFGWGPIEPLGAAGAGWGLVISFGAGALVLLSYLRSSRSLVTLAFHGVTLRWALFADFLKVGVPGTINVVINNLSVIALTAIAGHLGTDAAIAYGMGARLEYILIPIAFGFGTSIVAMVGTNWGAKQHDRAIRIAWSGATAVAIACGAIGLFFSVFPDLWMGLFTDREEIVRAGSRYLNVVGPLYAFYGLGMALYFATQGLGQVVWTVIANGVRVSVSVCGGLLAVFWLDGGLVGFFGAVAGGFVIYGLMNALVLKRHSKVVITPIRAIRPALASVVVMAFLITGVIYGTAHAQVLATHQLRNESGNGWQARHGTQPQYVGASIRKASDTHEDRDPLPQPSTCFRKASSENVGAANVGIVV
jgi:putative MATE family efflux protein